MFTQITRGKEPVALAVRTFKRCLGVNGHNVTTYALLNISAFHHLTPLKRNSKYQVNICRRLWSRTVGITWDFCFARQISIPTAWNENTFFWRRIKRSGLLMKSPDSKQTAQLHSHLDSFTDDKTSFRTCVQLVNSGLRRDLWRAASWLVEHTANTWQA